MENNCHVEEYQKVVRAEDIQKAQVAYLTVEGMGCPRCALRVQNSLNRIEGIFEASVYLEHKVAEVYYDADRVKLEEMVSAVASAGDEQKHRYRAQVMQR